MKNSIRVVLMALLAVGLWRCADQQPENSAPRDVQFTVRTSKPTSNGRMADLPPGTELLLSVQTGSGQAVFTHSRIELLKLGEDYVSKAFKLAPGTYAVTDFMLVLGDSVLYATPKAGSPLADQVANPLPYSFTVAADELLTLEAEVLATEGTSMAQFGYVAFDISGIEGRILPVTVFTIDQTGQHLADDVELTILHSVPGGDIPATVRHYFLDVGSNEIPFDLNPRLRYTLVVTRHGFNKYVRDFTFSELETDFSGGTLEITLTPAFTYVIKDSPQTWVSIVTDRSDTGTLTVDFSTYTEPSVWNVGGGMENYFEHQFYRPGSYFVTAVGDLDFIEGLYMYPSVSEIDVTHLSELKELHIYDNPLLRELDLSQNHKFSYLNATNTALTTVSLWPQAPIREVRINNTAFTTQTISALIDGVYAAAMHNNIQYGLFVYENVAPPTQAAKNKLQELEQLGWTITPSPSSGN